MALIRFRPFPQVLDSSKDVMDLPTQVSRLFDNFFGQPSPSGLMERAVAPPVDVYETKDEVSWSRWSYPASTRKISGCPSPAIC
jgi:HSP20 family molecular chaperone IbpA